MEILLNIQEGNVSENLDQITWVIAMCRSAVLAGDLDELTELHR
jgi:hypothetical protein